MYLTEILKRCSAVESRVAALYRALAERVDRSEQRARVWRELALEEEIHADILHREIHALEAEDSLGAFLPDFEPRLVQAERVLRDLEGRLDRLESLDEAATLALAVEQAELEDLYDDLVALGHTEFKLISERLEAPLSARPAVDVPGVPRQMSGSLPKGS